MVTALVIGLLTGAVVAGLTVGFRIGASARRSSEVVPRPRLAGGAIGSDADWLGLRFEADEPQGSGSTTWMSGERVRADHWRHGVLVVADE